MHNAEQPKIICSQKSKVGGISEGPLSVREVVKENYKKKSSHVSLLLLIDARDLHHQNKPCHRISTNQTQSKGFEKEEYSPEAHKQTNAKLQSQMQMIIKN
jgi:hypothetical protein